MSNNESKKVWKIDLNEFGKINEPKVAKLGGLCVYKAEDVKNSDLVNWSLENNTIKKTTNILEIELDDKKFYLLHKYQVQKFKKLYYGKSEVYLKVNKKGYHEIALNQEEIDEVKKNLKPE